MSLCSCSMSLFWGYAGPAAITISSPATNSLICIFKGLYLTLAKLATHYKMGAAVFCVALLGLFAANWPFFPITHRADAIRLNALADQELLNRVGATIAQSEVVFLAAALVAMAFYREPDCGVRLQPGRVLLQHRHLIGSNVSF